MKKFDKYLNKKNTPMPKEHLDILAKGVEMSAESVLPLKEMNKLLDIGYLAGENGFRRNEDGSVYAAVLTKMPKVTIDMLDWLPFKGESLVAHNTQPFEVTHKTSKEVDFVSIDKLIKRTRMQWQRSLDTKKELTHRENNRRKAEENIAFMRSIGVKVSVDELDETKLIIRKKEIA